MGIAALVLGIVSCILGLIPFCGLIALVPAIVGIILGIVDLVKRSKEGNPKGVSIAGLVLSAFAVIFIIFWVIVIGIIGATTEDIIDNKITNYPSGNMIDYPIDYEEDDETEEFFVGQTFEDDYMKVTYTSLNDNFTDYSKYATINDGYKIICATFEFENISSSNQLASSYRFNCYADGYDCDNFYSVDDSTFSASLSTGKKAKGSVYFQVPVDADEVVIEYQSNILSNKTAKFIVK